MKQNAIKFIDMYTKKECVEKLPNQSRCDFLEERNKKYMNYTALSFGSRKVTYEELHEKIDEYAKALYKAGIRQEEKIAVNVLNTPEAVYLLYALDKIGCTVVGLSPLNNEYKMQRDLELTKPNRIISTDIIYEKAQKAVDSLKISPILFPVDFCASSDFEQLSVSNAHNLLKMIENVENADSDINHYDPQKTTDILFTGGSTGVHKGVELIGNGLNCVVQALDHVFYLEPGMIHLGNIPFGHMAFGRMVLHYALAKNLNYSLTLKAMPQDFLEEVIRTRAHGAMGGPVHWENIDGNPLLKEGCLSNLIQAVSGGEYFKPIKREKANAAIRRGGSKAVIGDGLGLTEMWAPTHICVGGKNTPGTIGYAIPYVETKIVDHNFCEVNPGERGTVLVKGPGMMKGYYQNQEETRKVFWIDKEGATWYNTGDIARKTGIDWNEYEYIGRQKRNFVCGVDNIYPEQIEEILLQLPNIREVIVTKIPDNKYQYFPKYHISVFSMDFDQKQFENQIRELISSTLGQSAEPRYLEYTDVPLPRTDNGKLNATLLEAQDMQLLNN
ncbi:MAG: acyl--CoA ligase [Bacteroidales bacterium]|nr:acyl--CoA ligase [Bacteroidales bacterium]MCM1415785.1 acyl--CoA ligase [bacterium]MCM1422721.1 acyl--CoA ligase [bacterium]